MQLLARLEVAVLLGEVQRVAERPAARDDRDLVHAVDAGQQLGAQRVAGLVEGDDAALVVVERAARLHAGDDALERGVEVGLRDARRGRARAAKIAASLQMLARSAPVRPGGLAGDHREVDVAPSGLPRVCTLQDRLAAARRRAARRRSGGRSGRGAAAPGRASRAGSRRRSRRGRRVEPKPSISTSSWLSVCSRSELLSEPRWPPTASISSMKMIAGRLLARHRRTGAGCARRRGRRTSRRTRPPTARRTARRTRARRPWPAASCRCRAGRAAGCPSGTVAPSLREALGVAQELDDLLQLGLGLVGAGDVVPADRPTWTPA